MVIDGEGEFDQDVLVFGSLFRTKYDPLVEIKKCQSMCYGFGEECKCNNNGDQFL